MKPTILKNYFYDVLDDLERYPDCIIYLVIGGRNTGKTYSMLRYCVEHDKKFIFLKRTDDDITLLCSGSSKLGTKQKNFGFDLSPFKSLNRDFGWNIRAFQIHKGLGGFWNVNEEGEAEGECIGYLLSNNKINKYKGFDLSECEYIIFDEFIPLIGDRVNRREGELLMDLYKTVSRARDHFDMEPLKIVGLANSTSISNPIMNTLEVVNDIAEMQSNSEPFRVLEDRGIFLRILNDNVAFKQKEAQSKIYKAMKGTKWADAALDAQFAYDDFTNVKKVKLKNFRCLCEFKFKNAYYYVYTKEGDYHVCTSKSIRFDKSYDLNLDNDFKKFYLDQVLNLSDRTISGHVTYSDYVAYDLIMNYKSIFKL